MLTIIQVGPVEIVSFKNSEYLHMRSSFCEKTREFFPRRFFFFRNPEGKKKTVKSSFTEVGRRSYVIAKKKNQPPLVGRRKAL